jgi:hypothetical protein
VLLIVELYSLSANIVTEDNAIAVNDAALKDDSIPGGS